MALAGITVLLRAFVQTSALAGGPGRTGVLFRLIELSVLLAVTLVLAGVAWWLVLRLRESHRQLQDLAIRDPLTGLYNRRYFREVYAAEVQRAQRTGGPFSVAMLDLDGFKLLNDTKGHSVGDVVLAAFADLLRSSMRSVDVLARYGGDEFVILMPMTNTENAATALQRMERNLARWRPQSLPEGLRVSVGVSTWDGHTEVLEQADMKMYEAKKERAEAERASETRRAGSRPEPVG